MSGKPLFLIVNVGSTSTKAALFRGTDPLVRRTIPCDHLGTPPSMDLFAQAPVRRAELIRFCEEEQAPLAEVDLFISRGGLGKPGPSGVYRIDEAMCRDLLEGAYGRHSSALGPVMMHGLAREYGRLAVTVDPPSTDEFDPLSRLSGLPGIERRSAFHALNQKAAARRAARAMGRAYEEARFVVAHLGGGITIGAHRKGRVVDCTHGLSEGPFTPERAGGLPTMDLLNLAFSPEVDRKELQVLLAGRGGLFAYLGTTDARQVEAMVEAGDQQAELVYRAMAYQVAKDIGAMSIALRGPADGIILTGGLAGSEVLTGWIREWVQGLGPLFIYPGEDEMAALAEGGLRALQGELLTY